MIYTLQDGAQVELGQSRAAGGPGDKRELPPGDLRWWIKFPDGEWALCPDLPATYQGRRAVIEQIASVEVLREAWRLLQTI